MSNADPHSYRSILKSTSLMGVSSVLTVLIGVLRTKVFAILLGPTGIGLIGIFASITQTASVVAGMGVNRSGVRQIAEAVGEGDAQRIAAVVKALRRVSFFFGLLGGLLLLVFSRPISQLTFGETTRWQAISVLGLVVFFTAISDGQVALIQGLRRLGDLVKIRVLGAIWGTVVGIPIVWKWGDQGVVWMLASVACMGIITSAYYARRVEIAEVEIGWAASAQEAKRLLKMGVAFMGSGMVAAGATYAVRWVVIQHSGLEAAGQYFAAQTLSGVYAGFILQAMGADFYPRLTAVAKNRDDANNLVNRQAEVAVLLAVPGLLAILSFAPWVIQGFYSSKFGPAVEVLRWQVLGLLGQVISWPMGFIPLAKGNGKLFFTAELVSNSVHLILAYFLINKLGLVGTGIAFMGLYAFHCVFIYSIARYLTGFRWSKSNKELALRLGPAVAVVFSLNLLLSPVWAMGIGALVTVGVGLYCLRCLIERMGPEGLPGPVRTLLARFPILNAVAPK